MMYLMWDPPIDPSHGISLPFVPVDCLPRHYGVAVPLEFLVHGVKSLPMQFLTGGWQIMYWVHSYSIDPAVDPVMDMP